MTKAAALIGPRTRLLAFPHCSNIVAHLNPVAAITARARKASVLTVVAMVLGFYLLSLSMREIPLGTAYGIWVGIGAVGAAVLGIMLLGESPSPPRIASILLIVAGVIGLRLFSGP